MAGTDGIFILAPLAGPAAERIRELNERYDPKLARSKPPHVTLAGSSGVGPIPPTISIEEIRAALEPIARSMAPLELFFGAPERFLATDIIILPLGAHGSLRILHDRIATSGLPFSKPRFTFSPHVTLSLYPTRLKPERLRKLLNIRVEEPITIDTIEVYHTRDPQPARKLLELKLSGGESGHS
jgi:2'-5' RNA ligase